jgi:hypothetical protein
MRTGVEGTISTDPKELISAVYLKKLLEVGGLPRTQGVAIFRLLLAPDRALCGGVNCAKLLQIKQNDVEPFFDSLLEAIENSPALKSPQRAHDRTILRRSFAKPEPGELIKEIGKEAKVNVPEFAPKPLKKILSREALTSKIKQQSLRAIQAYTEDDSGAVRMIEAYSAQELEKKALKSHLLTSKETKQMTFVSSFRILQSLA